MIKRILIFINLIEWLVERTFVHCRLRNREYRRRRHHRQHCLRRPSVLIISIEI